MPNDPEFEKLKLLFDYTKFHIGMYTAIATISIGILSIKGINISVIAPLLWISVLLMALAGFAGGVVLSTLTQNTSHKAFMENATGPWRWKWFCGERWTYIEHTAFWFSLVFAFLAFLLAGLHKMEPDAAVLLTPTIVPPLSELLYS